MKSTIKRYDLQRMLLGLSLYAQRNVKSCTTATFLIFENHPFQKLKSTLKKLAKGNDNYKSLLDEATKIQNNVELEKKAKQLKIQPPKYEKTFQ